MYYLSDGEIKAINVSNRSVADVTAIVGQVVGSIGDAVVQVDSTDVVSMSTASKKTVLRIGGRLAASSSTSTEQRTLYLNRVQQSHTGKKLLTVYDDGMINRIEVTTLNP